MNKSAEDILKECTGHSYGLTNVMHIKAMKEYANQKLDEAVCVTERIIITDYALRIEVVESIDSIKDEI